MTFSSVLLNGLGQLFLVASIFYITIFLLRMGELLVLKIL